MHDYASLQSHPFLTYKIHGIPYQAIYWEWDVYNYINDLKRSGKYWDMNMTNIMNVFKKEDYHLSTRPGYVERYNWSTDRENHQTYYITLCPLNNFKEGEGDFEISDESWPRNKKIK